MLIIFINTLLQLTNTYIFFKGILGYQLRIKRSTALLTFLLVFLLLLLKILSLNNNSYVLFLLSIPIFILLPTLFFDGDIKTLFFLGINYRLLSNYICSIVINISSYTLGSGTLFLNGCLTYLILLVLLSSISISLHKLKVDINSYLQEFDITSLILFTLGLLLIKWSGGVLTTDANENIDFLLLKSQLLSGLLLVLLCVGIFLSQILIIQKKKLLLSAKLNQDYMDIQLSQYQRLQKKDEEIQTFKHDYKAHMSIINAYLKVDDIHSVKKYINQIQDIEDQLYLFVTGNTIVDAILNQYKEYGAREDINIEVFGFLPTKMNIKESDLCGLFSNAMSNAYEATQKCKNKRTITIVFSNNRDYLFIKITNPTLEGLNFIKGIPITTKSQGSLHGFGTKNMIEIAKKYEGKVTWEEADTNVLTYIRLRYK